MITNLMITNLINKKIIDADGDGWSDKYELERFDPMVNSFKYNPKVSDLPLIKITVAQEPIISIDYKTQQVSTRSSSASSSSSSNTTIEDGWSSTNSSQLEIGITAGWDLSKGGPYGEVNETLTLSNSFTNSFNKMVSNSKTLARENSISNMNSIETQGAKIVCPIYITNYGNMPIIINNMTLTAYIENYSGNIKVIGTLIHDGGDFPQLNLPANSSRVLVNFKNDTLYPSDIESLFL